MTRATDTTPLKRHDAPALRSLVESADRPRLSDRIRRGAVRSWPRGPAILKGEARLGPALAWPTRYTAVTLGPWTVTNKQIRKAGKQEAIQPN